MVGMGRRDLLILVVVFLLIAPGLFWGLPSAITPQVDSPAPLGPLLFAAEYGKGTLSVVYPVFHQLLLLPSYALVAGGFWVAGGLSRITSAWPYGFRDPSQFFSALILVTNLVSAVMGVGLLWTMRSLARLRPTWAWVGLLIIGTNGVFVYYSRVGNLDLPYTFWWGVACYFLWRYFFEDDPPRWSLIAAGVAAAASAGSKDQGSSLAIGAGLLILLMSPKQPLSARARFRSAVLFTLALLVSYFILAILPEPRHWWSHFRFVTGPHAPTDIPLTPEGELRLLGHFLRELVTAYTVPVLVVAVLGAVWLFRQGHRRHFWLLMLPMITYYLIVIAKTRVLYPRFMVPFVIPIFVLVTYGAAMIADRLGPVSRKVWVACIGLFIVAQLALSYTPVTYAQMFDTKRQLAADLPRYVPPGEPLLISRMQSYNFPNRAVYDRYHLMMLPNDPIVPPSRHAAGILHPLDPNVTYYLLGSGTTGLPWHVPGPYPEMVGEKIAEWRYPPWVRRHLIVPCLYEFTLYRRTGPLPDTSRPVAPPAAAPPG
jgi:4-amino-4-deoxy-L-arabinose transferase-like glycosyltransferase